MNIVLIGYRGAGKTTVGSKLATRLGKNFVDTDELVEKSASSSIREIVNNHGWPYFRNLEKRIIAEISARDNLIIAPGGGAVLNPENVLLLRKNGLIIWLKADVQVLWKRMDQDPRTAARRPTLTGKGTREEFEEVMAGRRPFYQKAADLQLDTSTLDLEAVVENLLPIIQQRIGA